MGDLKSYLTFTQTKFILPPSCEKWVIQTARDAWKRFKGKVKRRHFVPYDNIEDMVKNRPLHVPGSQFIKLILYWSQPIIQRASNGTNEEPKRFEMFIATRTSQKRKELDKETQTIIVRASFIINSYVPACGGQLLTLLYLFVVFKKTSKLDKPPVRQKRKLSKISAIKEQHQEEVQYLKGELGDVKEEVHGLRNMVKLLLQRSEPGISPEEIEAMLRNPQHSPVDANSGHGSTHAPNIHT
ncbi:hypothetical protein PIB30_110144, partial [Stylosanthes scabra]|nr:hypothetical protein [Stylosanthes scabra]